VAPRTREALADVPVIDLMQMPGTPPAGSGYVYPTPVRRVLPEYTEPAIRARLQGSVELEIVILPDGTVGAASIRRSLDRTHGLDGEALIAAQYWLFAPATRNGKPIAVTSRLVLDFTLQ
jgi:protein TonB